jgi:hypothetical protein
MFLMQRILNDESSIVTTLDNHEWWTDDLYERDSLMWGFTMFFVSSLAIVKTVRNEKLSGAEPLKM